MSVPVEPTRCVCDRCGNEGWCYPIDGLTTQERGKAKRPFMACCQPNHGQRWLPNKRKTDDPKTTAELSEGDLIRMLEE